MITKQQAAALAVVLSEIRSDWLPNSLMTLLEKHHSDYEFPALAQAAVNAAMNPNNRTPAIIFLPGPHWGSQNLSSSERRMQHGRQVAQQMASRQPMANPFESKDPKYPQGWPGYKEQPVSNVWAEPSEFDKAQQKLLTLPDAGEELLQEVRTEHPNAKPSEHIKLAAHKLGQQP